MAIHYTCRYCGIDIGTITQSSVDAQSLGFHKLTEDERLDMIQYDSKGNIHVKSICEDCHESFMTNPMNYENDYIIH